MGGKVEREKTMLVDGRLVRPDFVVDYGDKGYVAINLKCFPGTNKDNGPLIGELELFELLGDFLHKMSEESSCSFGFIEKDNRVFVSYNKEKSLIGFVGYESIICKRCLSNPFSPVAGKSLYDDFVELKNNNFSDIFVNEYKEQVRSAVERVNKKLKKFFGLNDDVFIYSSFPRVVVNSIFLKRLPEVE